ncbi:leucine-rich repeat domain-containing protein [Wenyingzhuangia sp.]|uniref:leucine-rich repeat domain-containing protein n=2 Tax=Wenyingzhuangia sp. TaxID=1964193 RepID=UPI00321B039A
MIRIKFILAMFSISLGFSQTKGETFFASNDIEYIVTSSTPAEVEAKDYVGATTEITIPNTVIHNAVTYRVTSIGVDAFTNNNLTSVEIASSLTTIGAFAFFRNSITSVTFSEGLVHIGNNAFQANLLDSVIFPNTVTSIGASSFFDNHLTSISLPDRLTSIGQAAFLRNDLTSVILPAQITHIGTEAFRFNDINTVTSLSIEPANLGDDVFIWDNDNDNSVIDLIIPSGTAAAYATAGWTGFKSVTEDEDLSVEDFQVEQNIDLHLVYDNLHITSKNNTQIKSVYIFTIL